MEKVSSKSKEKKSKNRNVTDSIPLPPAANEMLAMGLEPQPSTSQHSSQQAALPQSLQTL